MTHSHTSKYARRFLGKLTTLKKSRWQKWGFNTMATTERVIAISRLPLTHPFSIYFLETSDALDNIVDAQKEIRFRGIEYERRRIIVKGQMPRFEAIF